MAQKKNQKNEKDVLIVRDEKTGESAWLPG